MYLLYRDGNSCSFDGGILSQDAARCVYSEAMAWLEISALSVGYCAASRSFAIESGLEYCKVVDGITEAAS